MSLHRSTLAAVATLRGVVPMFPCNTATGAIPVAPLTAREVGDLSARLGWPVSRVGDVFTLHAPGGVRVVGSLLPDVCAPGCRITASAADALPDVDAPCATAASTDVDPFDVLSPRDLPRLAHGGECDTDMEPMIDKARRALSGEGGFVMVAL